jgi:hypothetical protein
MRWDLQMAELTDGWAGTTHRRSAAIVQTWSRPIVDMETRFHGAIAAGTWRTGPSDTLGVLGRDRDELVHSRMLAWLLDPLGHHGLGGEAIRAFAEAAGITVSEDTRRAIVQTELTRPFSRADIVIESPQFGIVIENKLDAVEGCCQCLRLADDYPGHHLVFLTPSGRRPISAGDSVERWTVISWKTVTRVVGQLLLQASGAGVHVVEEYHNALRRIFG